MSGGAGLANSVLIDCTLSECQQELHLTEFLCVGARKSRGTKARYLGVRWREVCLSLSQVLVRFRS